MAKQKLEGLITQLHAKFSDSDTSPEQEALLRKMQSQLQEWDGPPESDNLVTTTELLLEELEESHPKAAAITREILETLGQIGI